MFVPFAKRHSLCLCIVFVCMEGVGVVGGLGLRLESIHGLSRGNQV